MTSETYRDPKMVSELADEIRATVTQPWRLMEVCGGQTHAIVRYGLDELLPDAVTLIHGPGCPVCVTPADAIDAAVALSLKPGVHIASFGDMLRVPGNHADLLGARAQGGNIHIVYSPLDALEIAEASPDLQVVFFAVGFETTAPANAMAVLEAQRRGLTNFSLLVSHVLVPPAIQVIMETEDTRIDGFLAAGHVCTIMGLDAYHVLSADHGVPIAITGFEPVDILRGVLECVQQLEAGRAECVNVYARMVRELGNPAAQGAVSSVFEVQDRSWRGLGVLPQSGWGLRPEFAAFDARKKFDLVETPEVAGACRAGDVLMGRIQPKDCPEFGKGCTPESPLGAPMVSGEGACAAYYRYRRPA